LHLNFKEILELIDKVADRGIGAVEIERAGTKIRIEGKSTQQQVFHSIAGEPRQADTSAPPTLTGAIPAPPPSAAAIAAQQLEESEAGLHIITSPIVGTFYRSPNPESDSFINVGDRITKGKVLCIVEAMKLMNEIESDVEGVLMKIYPSNGQPIEYGEKLFAVKLQ
jgi:acetyl-CoA carboxylase biotin carboxyl carrier protein